MATWELRQGPRFVKNAAVRNVGQLAKARPSLDEWRKKAISRKL